jgi:hypothetical protein
MYCFHKRAQHLNPAIDFRESRFSHSERFFPDIKVFVTTPGVYSSKPELATSYVFHYVSFTELIFLGGIIAEEAWSSITSYVTTVYELACESSTRVLWPRKVELFSPRYYLTIGLNNF